MDIRIVEEKKRIRYLMKKQRALLGDDTIDKKSSAFYRSFLYTYGHLQRFFVYVSYDQELSTHALIKKLLLLGKIVCVPWRDNDRMYSSQLFCWGDLSSEKYRIRVPGSPNCFLGYLDVVVVPGLAFDNNGGRLGYGRGYYDQRLSTLQKKHRRQMHVIGVGYDFQLLASVPCDKHDRCIDDLYVY